MKKQQFFVKAIIACLILVIVVSCGKSSSSTSDYTPPAASPSVSIYNMSFSPASKTVAKGTVVKWHNADSYAHTVTSNDGSTFDSGNIAGNADYSYTANTAGTFEYHCTIHGLAMAGTLIVTP